jgi:hypothetical protein
MAYERCSKLRNQRLPTDYYRDPERVVFLTLRATEFSSPFARPSCGQANRRLQRCDSRHTSLFIAAAVASKDSATATLSLESL